MELGAALEEMDRLIDVIAAADTTTLGAVGRGQTLEKMTALQRRLDHARHVELRRFEVRGEHRELGYVTPAQWAKDRLRCSGAGASRSLALARKLSTVPTVAERWAAGYVDGEHVHAISKVRNDDNADVFDEWEPHFASWATDLDYRCMGIALRAWKVHNQPVDGPDPAEIDRDAHVSSTLGDTVVVDAILDAVRGATFKTVFDRIVGELFDVDWAEASARLGRQPAVCELARTHAQRRADAMVEMAIRADRCDTTSVGEPARPLVTVISGIDGLAAGLATLWDGTSLSPRQFADILRDCDIERIVYDSDSVPIRYNPQRRLYTGKLRRAIQVRDRTCTGLGCDAPVERCQIDHIDPVAAGGTTTPENGRLACGPCNRARPRRRFTGDPPRSTLIFEEVGADTS